MQEDEERIKITFNTNADDAAKSTDNLATSIDRTIDSSEKLEGNNKKLGKSQKGLNKTTKEQKAGLDDLGGGLGGAIQGVKNLSKQFLLLMANPIILGLTAIVAAVSLLFKAFTSTKAGGEQLDRVMAGLSAVIDVLRDRFLKVVDVAKKLFTGDIIGAAKEYLSIWKGAGDEIAEEFNKAAEAARSLQEVADATRDLSVARAQLNKNLAESKALIEDENTSYEVKKKALEDVKKLEGEQTQQELENARKKLEAIQAQNALSDSGSADLQAEADAKIALFNLEKKSADDRRAIQRSEKLADNQERARKKAIAEERRARYKERKKQREAELKQIEDFNKLVADKEAELLKQLQDLRDDSDQEKLNRQQERDLAEIEALRQKGVDVTNMLEINAQILEEKQADLDEREAERKQRKADEDRRREEEKALKDLELQKKIADKEFAIKKAKQDSLNALGNASINAAKDLFGKNKKVQKAAIIAEGGVALAKVATETIGQVSKDNLASPLTFGMPWAGVHIATGALGAASIISNTQKALQAVGGGGGSIGSVPNIPRPTGVTAQPQTGFQASSENQIATSISQAQEQQQPIKAFVVTSEITEGQNTEAKIIQENSF